MGTDIVAALLAAAANVVAIVPLERIGIGGLPQGSAVPSLILTRVSRTGGSPLRGSASRWTDRVQVTALAPDYDVQTRLLAMIVPVLDGWTGTIAGRANVAVTSLAGGPDFRTSDSDLWMGSEDFSVSYPA